MEVNEDLCGMSCLPQDSYDGEKELLCSDDYTNDLSHPMALQCILQCVCYVVKPLNSPITVERKPLERDELSFLESLRQGTERCHPSRGDPRGITGPPSKLDGKAMKSDENHGISR